MKRTTTCLLVHGALPAAGRPAMAKDETAPSALAKEVPSHA